jgi:hypothetical protein
MCSCLLQKKVCKFFVQFDSCGSSSSVCYDSGREEVGWLDGLSEYVFGLVLFIKLLYAIKY